MAPVFAISSGAPVIKPGFPLLGNVWDGVLVYEEAKGRNKTKENVKGKKEDVITDGIHSSEETKFVFAEMYMQCIFGMTK